MNSTLNKILVFVTGAAIGSVVTWKLVQTKYEQIAREEIESVREYYAKRNKEELTDEAYGEDDDEDEDDAREEYGKIINEAGYSENKEVKKMEGPYVISPRDFDETDYATETLDYYEGDGVLVDAYGDVVEDVESMVGKDFAKHFGENEEDVDTVYVRNDEEEMDYEICRNFGCYGEDD